MVEVPPDIGQGGSPLLAQASLAEASLAEASLAEASLGFEYILCIFWVMILQN